MVEDQALHRSRAGLAVLIAITVVAATVGGAWIWLHTTSGSPASRTEVRADGPTLYGALAALNGSLSTASGGPWTLYAVWGIASPEPFDPDALGWNNYSQAVNSCSEEFSGLTMWNGSIPIFDGTFNSGTAPFWQFAFFSNSSQAVLIATNVLGHPHVYPPMAMTSPCAIGTALGDSPWVYSKVLSPLPVDTPILAESAMRAIGAQWVSDHKSPYEVYTFGFNLWGSGNLAGLIVKFARCAEIDYTGVQPLLEVGVTFNGSSNSYFVGEQGCGNVDSLNPPPPVYSPYLLNFTPPTTFSSVDGILLNQTFQVLEGNKTTGFYSNAEGLVSWMTTLTLRTAADLKLQSAAPTCTNWVSWIGDCPNATGWFAVLTSASGEWLDSYPSSPGGSQWELPTTSLADGQELVVVVPVSWNVAGDVLSVHGTASTANVSGNVSY
jgi:hypothetical protein